MKSADPSIRVLAAVAPCALGFALGCGGNSDPGPPADVHGSYTVSITDGASTCSLPNWTPGQPAANIPVTITQNGVSVSSVVGGLAGAYLNATIGADTFTGSVSGESLDMTLVGTNKLTSGGCTYTVNGHLTGSSGGDFIRGTILYSGHSDTSAACAAIQSCTARQDFNGTRPPTGA